MPGPRDIERRRTNLGQPRQQLHGGNFFVILGKVEHEKGFSEGAGTFAGQPGAARTRAVDHDERGIGITNVPARPDRVEP